MSTVLPPLKQPVQYLKGVGPKRAELLGELGIATVGDLLYLFPRTWQDRRETADLMLPTATGLVVLQGKVTRAGQFAAGPSLALFKATLACRPGKVEAVWFKHRSRRFDVFASLKKEAAPGSDLWVVGRAEPDLAGIRELKVDEHYPLSDERWPIHVQRLAPVYPLTEGLSQRFMRELLHAAVGEAAEHARDVVPPALTEKRGLLSTAQALRAIHFPGSAQELEAARTRLAYEELLLLETAWLLKRRQTRGQDKGYGYTIKRTLLTPFKANLGFELTHAQKHVINEIFEDMQAKPPMTRLVQGDVGSGKTVVALAALLLAVESGHQGALMAPTEVLAEQHYRTAKRLLSTLPVKFTLLTGRVTGQARLKVLDQIRRGDVDIIIGTHAILEQPLTFPRLKLAVIDEQHRFGVRQRATLRQKGDTADLLVMTATPIPRTLALSLYGDLDASTIDELPPGKARIDTERADEEKALAHVRAEAEAGRQSYIVYPIIEENPALELRSAKAEFERLKAGPLAGLSVDLLHGAMSSKAKALAMQSFAAGETDVLIATQVIEVGIDVPNATVMVIQNADRFGLASLHQLRGRIGRGSQASRCFLVAPQGSPIADERLRTLCSSTDGFRIAEEDLKLRGPGELLGTSQHGDIALRVADLLKDGPLLAQAREDAAGVLEADPRLAKGENSRLRERLVTLYARKWQWIDLA
jgi:ATP-dependent DNA helicase RecG